MESKLLRNAVALAFDTYLDEIEASDDQHAAVHREQRRLCGRWLTMRRAQYRLSEAMIEERTGIELHQLVLFEAGLANLKTAPHEAWHRLALVLEDDRHDLDWVTAVMFGALGELGEDADMVIERVTQELDAVLNANQTAFQNALRDLHIQPDAFFTMMALLDGPLDVYRVVQSVAKNKKVALSEIRLPDISRTLGTFEKSGYVSTTAIGQHPSAHAGPIYRLTAEGDVFAQKLAQLGQLYQQVEHEKQRMVSQERQLQRAKAQVEQFFQPLGLSL